MLSKQRPDWFGLAPANGPPGVGHEKERGIIVMQRTLNAFENAFDRLAAGYFLVIALGVAAAVASVVL